MVKELLRVIVRAIVWVLVKEIKAKLGPNPKTEEVKKEVSEMMGFGRPGGRGRKRKRVWSCAGCVKESECEEKNQAAERGICTKWQEGEKNEKTEGVELP